MTTFERITRLILHHRWIWLALLLAVCAALAAGIPRLSFSSDNRAYFGSNNQELRDLQALESTYSGSSTLLFMVVPPGGMAFAPETLSALRRMTEEAWQVPYVLRVDSPTNYVHARAEGDEIIVEPLLTDNGDITEEDAARFRDIAMADDQLVDRLLASDGSAYGIAVQVVLPGDTDAGRQEVNSVIKETTERWRAETGFDIRVSGGLLAGVTLTEAARDDLSTLVPIAFVTVVALMALLLRSRVALAATMAVLALATTATLGFAGWIGVELTAGTAISPLSVMVLVSTSCVHIQLAWVRARQAGSGGAIATALAENLGPVTVTNLTTATGFLCLNFAQSPPLRDMGNIVAFGLLFGLAATFVILPIGLELDRGRRSLRIPITVDLMERLANRVLALHRLWLVAFPLAAIVAVTGILRLDFNDSVFQYFDHRYAFRADADAIQHRLTGLESLQFSLHAPEGESVFEPDFLLRVDRFSTWLAEQPEVVSVSSITSLIKVLHRRVNGDTPAEERIADSREANAQLILFYELSLPVGMDLNATIDIDRTRTRVGAILVTDHSAKVRDLADRAEAWLIANEPSLATRASGLSIAFARLSARNNAQMLLGLGAVLVLVSATMMVTLRSVRMGVISLAPNLVPAILAFGLWGYTFRDVNLGSTVVTTMTFGIVVDDTVHFMMHYLRRRRAGDAQDVAMRDTFTTVGAAIVITSVALIAGFSIMALSGFAINQHVGALTVIVIGFALIADLLFLPALLHVFEGKSE